MIRNCKSHFPLLLVLCAYTIVRAAYWDCQPIWDGRVFYQALAAAKDAPFDILKYSCDGHICQGFYMVMGLPYALYKGSYVIFNIWLTLFSMVSIVAFYGLLSQFATGLAYTGELALATALFAFHPSIISSMAHFNLDIGVLTFGLLYWLMLMKHQRAAATIFATLMLFSKEPSILLLPLPFLFCWLQSAPEARWRWVRGNLAVLLIPYLILGCFLIYRSASATESAGWIHYGRSGWTNSSIVLAPDAKLMNYLGMIFILNFNWVLSFLWIGLICTLFFKRRLVEVIPVQKASLLYLMFLSAAFILTLVRPFSNVRYLLFLFPIMLLAVHQLSLVLVRPGPRTC